jgi:hypothetical protein
MEPDEDITALAQVVMNIESKLDLLAGRLDRFATLADLERLATKDDTDRILTILDGVADRLSDDTTERAALTAQVDRHERWIERASSKTGVSYTPGS